MILGLFDSLFWTCMFDDRIVDDQDVSKYSVEFINAFNLPGLHAPTLKVGGQITLLWNINPPKLCNGTCLQLNSLRKYAIETTITTG